MGFIGWLIVGLIAEALARLLVPGRQPMGIFMTMVLGLIGSFVGGAISDVLVPLRSASQGFHTGGIIMSTIGAVIVLAIYLSASRIAARCN
jgi:uncharacterized membrane protein YeaQ/YmgE (transglycosylase-associated protein family)